MAPSPPGTRIVVAYSGGPDSTALLAGLSAVRETLGVELVAAHYDHRLDADSTRRAVAAQALAQRLGVEYRLGVRTEPLSSGEGIEDAARRLRYRFLERIRRHTASRWIATAHHRDDQTETVLLRLLQGTGLNGLAGVRVRLGHVVRPLLDLTRSQLRDCVDDLGLVPVTDPTNATRRCARSRLRHDLLPALARAEPRLPAAAASLAARAARTRPVLERKLSRHLRLAVRLGTVELDLERFAALDVSLQQVALTIAGRSLSAPYAPTARSLAALDARLRRGGRVACDLGRGLRIERSADRLFVLRREIDPSAFTYTLEIPGCVWIPESSAGIRVRCSGAAAPSSGEQSWCRWPADAGRRFEIRTRRPGDWIVLSGNRRRTVKDLMSTARFPRPLRDRLPLLCAGAHVLWIPGIATDRSLEASAGQARWLLELIDLPPHAEPTLAHAAAARSLAPTPAP